MTSHSDHPRPLIGDRKKKGTMRRHSSMRSASSKTKGREVLRRARSMCSMSNHKKGGSKSTEKAKGWSPLAPEDPSLAPPARRSKEDRRKSRALGRKALKATVLHDLAAEFDGDLPLREGEEVLVRVAQGMWWEGENSEGVRGVFPSNFVLLQDDSKAKRKWGMEASDIHLIGCLSHIYATERIHAGLLRAAMAFDPKYAIAAKAKRKKHGSARLGNPFEALRSALGMSESILAAFNHNLTMEVASNGETIITDASGIWAVVAEISGILRMHVTLWEDLVAAEASLTAMARDECFLSLLQEIAACPRTRGHALGELLGAPLERVQRLSFLCNEMLSRVPLTHPDHQEIGAAIAQISIEAAAAGEIPAVPRSNIYSTGSPTGLVLHSDDEESDDTSLPPPRPSTPSVALTYEISSSIEGERPNAMVEDKRTKTNAAKKNPTTLTALKTVLKPKKRMHYGTMEERAPFAQYELSSCEA